MKTLVTSTCALLLVVLTACEHRAPATTVHAPYSIESGVTTETLDDRTVMTDPDAPVDMDWYRQAGQPTVALLVNRRIQGDDASWAASTRFTQVTEYLADTQASSGAIRQQGQVERRQSRGEGWLPDPVALQLQHEVSRAMLAQTYRLVDADIISRLAQAAADRQRHHDQPIQAANLFSESLAKEADWVIELIGVPSGNGIVLQAKVVSLDKKRLLGVVSSRDLQQLGPLPGSLNDEQQRVRLEKLADKLVAVMSARLARTTTP